MGVITVSVEDEVERNLRRIAGAVYGKRKGYLGKAITQAIKEWLRMKSERDTVTKALELLESGIDMGGIKYKNRDELHER